MHNLLKAKKLVEGGWCQKSFHEGDSYCAMGALMAVETVRHSDYGFLLEAINGSDRFNFISLTQWNDKTERTKEQVLKLFDKAIKIAEARVA